jgi:hypothetical protein
MGILYCFAGVANEETQFILQSASLDRVREVQQSGGLLQQVRALIQEGGIREFTIDGAGAIRFHGHICVPQKSQDIGHFEGGTSYSVHHSSLGYKEVSNLEKTFWWKRMKVDIAKYVSTCDVCP